ncbi:ACP phosphodiesterase [Salinisphaera orenii]|uniref:ACP phosphodiesterase n=1 Tax=Salinisphaera orenii YIM 95161 TaxID=1051139 RepID=A0A423Q5W6_9GAMM|nr:ACP phosphodiesterase [Salinisphaera halophila]ROO34901.1 ACP phosphodiesterase [Salinisphaera halophila YIM 95161]
MNLLVHLYLAERTGTSAAGQILGDMVKGRLDGRHGAAVERGIRLHRGIDRVSDDHEAHRAMRRRFPPPLRRYAGILVDIGFDYSLARAWPAAMHGSLVAFAQRAQRRVIAEWPQTAPLPASRMRGLAATLAGYADPSGIQRALDSVASRLARASPVADALPAMLAERPAFDARLPDILADLDAFAAAGANESVWRPARPAER